MPKIISKEDQKLKMRKLYNYENLLYPALKERNTRLRKDLKELKRVNKELEKENKLIQKLLLELEELKEMHY
jgi:septal ring factor EnvC (AmiA/AmiB activator)